MITLSHQRIINYFVYVYALFALVFVSLAIIGGVRNFSSVPYDDMWGGYLNFFLQASQGSFKVWFASWNEHPIILSRVLFWIDLQWFKGLSVFLIVVNYSLIACSCWVFSAFLKEDLSLTRCGERVDLSRIFSLVIIVILFSWLESENLNWGFQSQFFLAQLLPLFSFYLLHRSYQSTTYYSNAWFLGAGIVGFASFATMANGVLALPLLTLLAYLLGMNKQRVFVLLLLTAMVWLLFVESFHLSASKMPDNNILQNKILFLKYLYHYFGGPAYYISHRNIIIMDLASVIFITAFIFKLWQLRSVSRDSSCQLALLFFVLYLICSGVIVAFGRFHAQIPSMRYMYPMLMGWSALLVLYASDIAKIARSYPLATLGLLLFIPLALLPLQRHSLDSQANIQLEKKTAALALALSVRDTNQIRKISQLTDPLLPLAHQATLKNISIFGQPPYQDLKTMMGKLESPARELCLGSINSPDKINDTHYVAVNGWIGQTKNKAAPFLIHILNKQHQIVGYALTAAVKSPDHPELSEFKGYMLATELGQQIVLNGKKPECKLVVQIPKTRH